MKQSRNAILKAIEWATFRLLYIAGNSQQSDEQAGGQTHRNVEVIRYKRLGAEPVLLNLKIVILYATAQWWFVEGIVMSGQKG